jgi:hypothetical protein
VKDGTKARKKIPNKPTAAQRAAERWQRLVIPGQAQGPLGQAGVSEIREVGQERPLRFEGAMDVGLRD